ncbi:hypothetical protein V511_12460 [Mesotoga sp. Brook.08.YT.4.2.5.1]|uniref:InlB B-repeat-containing protein n=1 Tax=unclassified Mesotoga TaxID=1184398 RepID=UPI000C9B053D|nr:MULTISPECIES: hypothetical protein [unclassified Mesotoga]PNE19823.1 hypothetical protein V511_12460 [Mesotoga sp. Brook.08.YT.4.2.5.1]RAM59093.1 hypothetical protein DS65_01215 [Mesotoga sp. SC_4PWL113PWK15]RAO96954.1 hypothetical protein M388_12535 [Mesotoga sp. Brook.08.YT.4.2.5.4.]RDI94327.1 hypothetical protein Q502_00800 [Mesotoga sp. Brook.08.YT.4.2.5.2.]
MAKKLLKLTTLLAILLLVFMLTGCPKPPAEEYTLTIEKTGNGTVTANPAPNTSGKYAAGTEVTLTAVADAGWQFAKWVVGETDVTNNTVVVTMDADKTVEAVFEEEEPPTDKYTLTITKTGQGTVVPAEGVHEYDEDTEVVLTATPAAGWNFSKWVVGGADVFENPTTVVMTSNKAANAVFVEEEPPVGPFPKITNLSLTTEDFMVLQPCTENLEIRFQVAVSGPESALVEAEYKVIHVSSGEFVAVEIPEDNWGAPWTYKISNNFLKDNIGNPIPGGKYDITVGATNTEGNFSSETISFYVKYELSSLEDAWIVESEDSQIKVVEGKCVVGEGDPATIGATIFYDSKITVRIYLVETSDTGILDEMLTKGVMIKEKAFIADSAVTEDVEIELPDLKPLMDAGTEYNLLVLLFTPECGALGCVSCGIEDWALLDCDLVEDTDPSIECLPCTCPDPCDPCFVGYNPGILISSVLSTTPDLFDISLTIGGEVIESGFTFLELEDALEVRFWIEDGTLDPDPSGDTDLYWTVVTPTGIELDATCTILIDFEEPEADIVIENCCVNEGITETTFSVTFTDNVGLKRGKISATGANVVLPDGKTAGNWFALSGTEATVEGTITGITGAYTVYVSVEDVSCLTSENEKKCGINTPPMVEFGPYCKLFDCPPACGSEEIGLQWVISDYEDNFDYFEIYVSHSAYGENVKLDILDPEQMEGHITWELGAIDCETVTATLIAYDDCEGSVSSRTKFWTSPYPMDNVEPEIELFWEDCGEPEECATSAVIGWTASDECLDTVKIYVDQGYLVAFDGSTGTHFTTRLATLTTAGTITWVFEDAVDCENIVARAWAKDTCGNRGYAEPLVSKNKIDNMEPGVFLGIWGIGIDTDTMFEDIVNNAAEFDLDEFIRQSRSDNDFMCTDARCLQLVWVIEENCLDEYFLTTNYPFVPCGTEDLEVPVDEYTYYDLVEKSLWVKEFVNREGRKELMGWINWCLPNIDCEDFVATLTADDTSACTDEVSWEESIKVDNVAPILEFEWTLPNPEEGEEYATSCATEATLTWSLYDNTYPCDVCGSVEFGAQDEVDLGCPIGLIILLTDELDVEELAGSADSLSDLEALGGVIAVVWGGEGGTNPHYTYLDGTPITDPDATITFDSVTNTYSGSYYYTNDEVDGVMVAAIMGAIDCCCTDISNVSPVVKWLGPVLVDNVGPELVVDIVPPLYESGCAELTASATELEIYYKVVSEYEENVTIYFDVEPYGSFSENSTTTLDGSVLLDVTGVDCEEITVTITVVPEAGCPVTEWTETFLVDNVAPNLKLEILDEATCGATQLTMRWEIDDECLICTECESGTIPIYVGKIELSTGETIQVEVPCGSTLPASDTFVWEIGEIDCDETLVATFTGWDASGNEASVNADLAGIDNKPPELEAEFDRTNTNPVITWTATEPCFDLVSIWVSEGTLEATVVGFDQTAAFAGVFDPGQYNDQFISKKKIGAVEWFDYSETAVATILAMDVCCNYTVLEASSGTNWFFIDPN